MISLFLVGKSDGEKAHRLVLHDYLQPQTMVFLPALESHTMSIVVSFVAVPVGHFQCACKTRRAQLHHVVELSISQCRVQLC